MGMGMRTKKASITDVNIQVNWMSSSPDQNTQDTESSWSVAGGYSPCTMMRLRIRSVRVFGFSIVPRFTADSRQGSVGTRRDPKTSGGRASGKGRRDALLY